MSAVTELQDQLTALQAQASDLQASVDAEQAQIQALFDANATVVLNLNDQITALQAQIAAGATADQLATIASGLTVIKDSINVTKLDVESTVLP